MGGIERFDVSEDWAHSGIIKAGDFYTMETHDMCLEELKALGYKRKEDDWCFERYNCPRFTTSDEKGNVILDYGISIEG